MLDLESEDEIVKEPSLREETNISIEVIDPQQIQKVPSDTLVINKITDKSDFTRISNNQGNRSTKVC